MDRENTGGVRADGRLDPATLPTLTQIRNSMRRQRIWAALVAAGSCFGYAHLWRPVDLSEQWLAHTRDERFWLNEA